MPTDRGRPFKRLIKKEHIRFRGSPMSRTRIDRLWLATLVAWATLLVPNGLGCARAMADQPNNQANQPKKKPHPQNAPKKDAPKKDARPRAADANVLSMELKALRVLRELDATPHQLSEIARAAKTTAGGAGKREPAKVSEAYIEALQQIRRAILANDEDKVEKLRTQIDEIEGKESPDLDDEIEITDGAEIEAVRLLNIFSPRQVVAYAQSLNDDFPDPVQLVLDGLEEGRKLKDEEWQTARNRVADEVGWLVCGLEGEKSSKLSEQVSAYLDQKHAGEAKGGNREAEIRNLIGKPGPVVLLKNVMEHTLAELLSNPQVERAARDCLRQNRQDMPSNKPAQVAAARPADAAPSAPKKNAKQPRPPESKTAELTAKRVKLDEVQKAPEDFAGQQIQFDRVTVIGTAPGKVAGNLLLAVKSSSGTIVNASRDQKLSFFMPAAKVPDAIKELQGGESGGVAATLTCTIRRDGPKHWSARVLSVKLHESH
jgi:hypothetical protein